MHRKAVTLHSAVFSSHYSESRLLSRSGASNNVASRAFSFFLSLSFLFLFFFFFFAQNGATHALINSTAAATAVAPAKWASRPFFTLYIYVSRPLHSLWILLKLLLFLSSLCCNSCNDVWTCTPSISTILSFLVFFFYSFFFFLLYTLILLVYFSHRMV